MNTGSEDLELAERAGGAGPPREFRVREEISSPWTRTPDRCLEHVPAGCLPLGTLQHLLRTPKRTMDTLPRPVQGLGDECRCVGICPHRVPRWRPHTELLGRGTGHPGHSQARGRVSTVLGSWGTHVDVWVPVSGPQCGTAPGDSVPAASAGPNSQTGRRADGLPGSCPENV